MTNSTYTDQNVGNQGLSALSTTYKTINEQVGPFDYLKTVAFSSLAMLLFFIAYKKLRVQKKPDVKEVIETVE